MGIVYRIALRQQRWVGKTVPSGLNWCTVLFLKVLSFRYYVSRQVVVVVVVVVVVEEERKEMIRRKGV